MSKPNIKRCAIYTRKSNEEGLEQEFNSLDAQREACEAYITSQKHEGWQMVKAHYDDGGFTGGNMNRPALKKLLEDIVAGKVDVIVVYKVDRLSRSLHDFARMVEVFDKHTVSFVSVTQQFNTTSSMGRLTLNVLLSFAQFEREVTGERIRDKIAASKAKGMWMGGFVPLGYDAVEKKLIINKQEVDIVRNIFQRYIELGNVRLLKEELDRGNIRSKIHIKDDKKTGGCLFSRGGLYKILSNPIYIGKIRHKELCHQGQHEAIIENNLWEQVQQQLKNNAPLLEKTIRKTTPSLLVGKLFDESGEHLAPSHAVKKGRRYRYYVSYSLKNGIATQNKQGWRLPAHEIEQTILAVAKTILNDQNAVASALQEAGVATHHIPQMLDTIEALCKKSNNADNIIKLIKRVDLRQDGMCIKLLLSTLISEKITYSTPATIISNIPMRIKRRGVEMRLIIDGATNSNADPILIKTIARANVWFNELASGTVSSVAEIATRYGISKNYVSNLLPTAFLSPEIINSIIEGKQPAELASDTLTKSTDLPLLWVEQKKILCFN